MDILKPDPQHRDRWKMQAAEAARKLKMTAKLRLSDPERNTLTIGFMFDDAIVKVRVPAQDVASKDVGELADAIYQLVVGAVDGKGPGR